MRRVTALVAVLLGLMLAGCAETDEVQLADGSWVPFEQFQGQWLVINYWAEWCAPCRKEIPELNRLHAGQFDTPVTVLGVNYDALTGEKLATLVAEMGIEYPVLVADPRARWNAEQPTVLPSTLLIDPAGNLAHTLVGPQHLEDFTHALGLEVTD